MDIAGIVLSGLAILQHDPTFLLPLSLSFFVNGLGISFSICFATYTLRTPAWEQRRLHILFAGCVHYFARFIYPFRLSQERCESFQEQCESVFPKVCCLRIVQSCRLRLETVCFLLWSVSFLQCVGWDRYIADGSFAVFHKSFIPNIQRQVSKT